MVRISFIKETSTRTQWIYILHSINKYILCCCFLFTISGASCSSVLDALSVQVWLAATGVPFGFLFCLLVVVMLFLLLFSFLTCLFQTLICITFPWELWSWRSPAWKQVFMYIYKYTHTPTCLSSKTVKKYQHKKDQNHFNLYLCSPCIVREES